MALMTFSGLRSFVLFIVLLDQFLGVLGHVLEHVVNIFDARFQPFAQ